MPLRRSAAALLATLGAATLACSSGSSASPQTARTEVTVAVTPGQVQLAPGTTIAFAATVTGTADTSVTWSVQEASGGAVDAAGTYQAPQGEGTYHVIARSVADPSASAAATVTVSAAPAPPPPPSTPTTVALTISPATAAVSSCQSVTLTATVTGSTNTAVSWAVQEGAAGGSVTPAGVYTAPAIAGTYHVVGTSQADPSKGQVVPVVVTDRILSVAVAPSTLALAPGQTAQFTATITTTCGAFTSSSTVTAPATAAN